MISVKVSGVQYDVQDKDRDYINEQIGKLDHVMSAKAKKGARAEVKIVKATKGSKKYKVEALVHSGTGRISAEHESAKLFPAIDKVEKKLKRQIEKKHDKRSDRSRFDRKRVFAKLRRVADRDFRSRQN